MVEKVENSHTISNCVTEIWFAYLLNHTGTPQIYLRTFGGHNPELENN